MITDANSVRIAYGKSGTGTPLILLHGCAEDRHIFDRIVPGLSERFTVYAVDSRNHGESEKTSDYSYSAMAEDLMAFTDALALAPADVVGFSDGAIVALVAAMRRPVSFRRLALLSVNLKPSDLTPEARAFIQGLYDESKDPRLGNIFVEPDIELADASKVKLPALVVGAENDVFRPELFRELAAAMPNAELMIMRGHDHLSYVVDKDILLPDLLRFFG
ncbi:MAG: alpha/beta hydrolase [Deltaproteobacteria bacterium]|jgi:pimeloyl-ACP methyl ester carboxylesterase|nr:alpha/beta hydrolase [Deltaproteobacteria bacterium]